MTPRDGPGSSGVWSYQRQRERRARAQHGAVEEGRASLPTPNLTSMSSVDPHPIAP